MNGAPKLIQKKPSIWLITAALIVSATQMRPSLGALVGIIIQAALLFLARYFAMTEGGLIEPTLGPPGRLGRPAVGDFSAGASPHAKAQDPRRIETPSD
jgi:hypothetical protein